MSLILCIGNIYGVLQIVYPFTGARTKASTAHGNTDYEAQIFGRICASYGKLDEIE